MLIFTTITIYLLCQCTRTGTFLRIPAPIRKMQPDPEPWIPNQRYLLNSNPQITEIHNPAAPGLTRKKKRLRTQSLLNLCRLPESNRYECRHPRDFKSRASASSAKPAVCEIPKCYEYLNKDIAQPSGKCKPLFLPENPIISPRESHYFSQRITEDTGGISMVTMALLLG